MSLFKNLKLQHKFALVGGISILLLSLSLISSLYGMKRMASTFLNYTENDEAVVLALKDMYALGLQTEQATRNILLNPADEKAAKNYVDAMAGFDKASEVVVAKSDGAESKSQIEAVLASWKDAAALRQQVQELAKAGQSDTALVILNKQETPKWREVKEKLFKLVDERSKLMAATKSGVTGLCAKTLTVSLTFGALAIISAILLVSLVVLGITRSIRNLAEMLEEMASGDGDLTRRLTVASRDDFGRLANSFNLFVEKLHGLMSHVSQASSDVSRAAVELDRAAMQMASGIDDVAAQSSSVATASEEISATSGDIAKNCTMAAEGAKLATESASAGAAVVQQTVQGMVRIAERVRESAQTVSTLGSTSDQIGAIIGTIEEIADQTNLLALNAAIEAARAGEQGRGFAVVADEVRALAERTTVATREIGAMIKAIQSDTSKAVAAMEEGVKEVDRGSSEAARSGEALDEILNQIDSVTRQVNLIAVAAEEQSCTTIEICNNMQRMTEVVNSTSEGAGNSAAAADNLSKLSDSLLAVVQQFKLA